MDTTSTGKLLLSLSLPIMFSILIQALYNIVDSIFIAHFSENALPVSYVLSLSRNLSYVWIAYPIAGAVSAGVCLFQWKNVFIDQ